MADLMAGTGTGSGTGTVTDPMAQYGSDSLQLAWNQTAGAAKAALLETSLYAGIVVLALMVVYHLICWLFDQSVPSRPNEMQESETAMDGYFDTDAGDDSGQPYPVPEVPTVVPECEFCHEPVTDDEAERDIVLDVDCDLPARMHFFCAMAPAMTLVHAEIERRQALTVADLRREIARVLEFMDLRSEGAQAPASILAATWRVVADPSPANRRALYDANQRDDLSEMLDEVDAAWWCLEALILDDEREMRDALAAMDRSMSYETLELKIATLSERGDQEENR